MRRVSGALPHAASPSRAALHDWLSKHRRLLLTTHVNPDGDAIGSEIAFARWRRAAGQEVRILNDSPTPNAFRWLTEENPVETYDEALAEARFSEADALIVLDTGNKQRIGKLSHHLDRHAIAIAIVDHHVTHEGFGHVNVIEPQLAATACLVYELMLEAGAAIDPRTAEALYVGLSTDTGPQKLAALWSDTAVKEVGQYRAKFVAAGKMRRAGTDGVLGTVAEIPTGTETVAAP